jgi:regulator of cell morphogenesis and NO signaling
MTTLSPSSAVGNIATEFPSATRVFARHGIDFCCGGGEPLSVACSARGIDVELVLRELERDLAPKAASEVRWDQEPLDALIDHILTVYHAPLAEELARIEEMARKVHRVHGDKDPERFRALLQTVLAIKEEIEQHLPKEEQILFPMIKAGQGGAALGPMSVMESEHVALGSLLRRARELTNDYVAPEGACNTWRALWSALEELERATHEHIHLENNILHPRARVQ